MENENGAPAGRSRAVVSFDGQKLKLWRTEVLTVSQVQLAALCEPPLSRGEISHLETGKRQPLATTLGRLCKALGCKPADLLTYKQPVEFLETKDEHAATQQQAVSA